RFFARDAVTLARALLGTVLVHDSRDGVTAGRIVEVEAYCGPEDRAAHSYGGRRTPRNEVMYGPPGHAYVYFVYGMHYCVNVVAAGVDRPEAVLIRALEPLVGVELMRRRRDVDHRTRDAMLARGPANLCRAMGIGRSLNGADLLAGPLRLERGRRVPPTRIAAATRVGIDYAGDHAQRLWRFYDRNSAAVSALPRIRRT
ncbi:MAG TPA: DNA-3-methyladenine glycosylase, partial [Candidatus Kryptonia bacterium]|nr:DNA-3-methyladenine glycosylase [Candidatus Kryptonia bacterium]